MIECAIETYFDIRKCDHAELFNGVDRVWDVLGKLDDFVGALIASYPQSLRVKGKVMPGAYLLNDDIVVEAGAVIEPGASIVGPTFVGHEAQIRHGAYLRDCCLLSRGAIVGHASEIKHSIMLAGSKAPHFAYVGDSILGAAVNLGAGTKLANLRLALDRGQSVRSANVVISMNNMPIDTGLRKLGAIVGDNTHIGCNSVTSPGTLLGAGAIVYPGTVLRKGIYAPGSIIKTRQTQEILVSSAEPS
jgi:UDP-N-acetylglucosamine diphosphorylase / glucose-1-phosphate thymidylyltransferase / UDP-N-acetylgalactosamine diphosphorylase / glucosamine-1-phosphate N-acetyltransferase / galactosamine-1-phosphate N-acetyltransferase